MNRKLNTTWVAITILILQTVFMAVFYFGHIFYSGMFESDAASDLVLSKLIFDEGKLIYSDNWWYSTESGLLNVVPFLGLFYHLTGDYQIAYGFTRIIMATVISVSAALMLKSAGVSFRNIIIGAILIIIPYGSYRRYSLFSVLTGIGYYAWLAIFPFLCVAIWLYIRKSDVNFKKRIILWVALFLISIICGIASIRFSFILILPFILTEVIDVWLCYLGGDERRMEKVPLRIRLTNLAVMLCGYLIGFVYHDKVLAVQYPSKDFGGLSLGGIYQIQEQFWLVLEGIIKSFGYAADGGNVFSFIGIFHLVCLAYLIVVIYMAIKLLTESKGGVWYVSAFVIIQFALGIFIQLVVTAYDIGAVQRYVWQSMFGCVLIPALYLEHLQVLGNRLTPVIHTTLNENAADSAEDKNAVNVYQKDIADKCDVDNKPMGYDDGLESRRIGSLRLLVILSVIGVLLANDFTLYLSYNTDRWQIVKYGHDVVMGNYRNATVEQRQGYINFLKENNLTLGRADFWDAAITTILTNDEITVCGANEDEYFTYKRWSNRKDYEDSEAYPPQFNLYTISMEQKRIDNDWPLGSKEIYRDDYFVVYEP